MTLQSGSVIINNLHLESSISAATAINLFCNQIVSELGAWRIRLEPPFVVPWGVIQPSRPPRPKKKSVTKRWRYVAHRRISNFNFVCRFGSACGDMLIAYSGYRHVCLTSAMSWICPVRSQMFQLSFYIILTATQIELYSNNGNLFDYIETLKIQARRQYLFKNMPVEEITAAIYCELLVYKNSTYVRQWKDVEHEAHKSYTTSTYPEL